jgi:hypothetical protein
LLAGKKISIFSDYPAREKLAAMGLAAHHVVAAGDVGLLKPHARGLQLRPVLRPRRPYSSATAQIATVVLDKGPESEY